MVIKLKMFRRGRSNTSTSTMSTSTSSTKQDEQVQTVSESVRAHTPTVQEERQAIADSTVANLDAAISRWELKLSKERSETKAVLEKMHTYKKKEREIPNSLKTEYARKKKAAAATEAQVERMRCKRDDVRKAAEVAELTESLACANSVQQAFQSDADKVADVLDTAEEQYAENLAAAEALAAHADGELQNELLQLDVDDEIDQFLIEQGDQVVQGNQEIPTPLPIVQPNNVQQMQVPMKPEIESPCSIKPRSNTGRTALPS